jgi:hypothetical protein
VTSSPGTAINNFGLKFATDDRFEGAFINEEIFAILTEKEPNPSKFWKMRASVIAGRLNSLQYVSEVGSTNSNAFDEASHSSSQTQSSP